MESTILGGTRSGGGTDEIIFVIDDETGEISYKCKGNVAGLILYLIAHPEKSEKVIENLRTASTAYEVRKSATVKVIKDPFEILRKVKEDFPEGPEKDKMINDLLDQISSELKKGGEC